MSVNFKDSPLSRLVIFTPVINIWSATVKVDRDQDLKDVKDKLPPRSLVSDGRKTLIDLKLLTPFNTLRSKVHRALTKAGFQLTPNAHAIPLDKADAIAEELEEIGQEFKALVPDFISNLDNAVEQHIAAEPEWRELIESSRPDKAYVESRMVFKIGAYRMAPPDEANPDSRISRNFGEAIEAVPSLLKDIAESARKLLEGPLGTGRRIGQSHANALRDLVAKLESFGFLDHRVGAAADTLDSMLSIVPETGQLSQGNLGVLKTVCDILSDPVQILEQANMDADTDDDTTTIVTAPTPSAAPQTTAATALDF